MHFSLQLAREGSLTQLIMPETYINRIEIELLCNINIFTLLRMELGNNALKIYREGIEFRRNFYPGQAVSTKCLQSYSSLSQCILQKRLNPLDHDTIRGQCEVEEWKHECPGALRRIHQEKIYRRSLTRRLYTQEQLDKYNQAKSHFKHYGLIDHRY